MKSISQGPKGVRENSGFRNLVPQGRLNLAQDASPGLDSKGGLSPAITYHDVPRTSVLG